MADLWGALGQIAPAATTLTDAYTVPTGKHATVEVIACNRSGAATVRVSHAAGGAADATNQYILFDYALAANATQSTLRFTAGPSDKIRVYASTATVTFNVNGIEETA